MIRALAAAAIFLAVLAGTAVPAEPAGIGVVVMHGKWGSPRGVAALADALEREGFVVANPEMPWSRRRSYDKSIDGAAAEIDAEIARLRDRGVKRIYVAGHSLGAAFALNYATRVNLDGLVAIAPGHIPEGKRFMDTQGATLGPARELVAAGRAMDPISFVDLNTGNRRETLTAPAAVYLSYFDSEGPMNMHRNAQAVRAGTPVLWLVPVNEEAPLRSAVLSIFRQLPAHAASRLAEPDSNHLQAPSVAAPAIVDWIRSTAARN